MKTGAIIGTGLGVSVVTGGVGIGPYLYGIGAATSASIALDGAVQARLATGDWPGAADQASYHLPFWGNARSGLAAWQQGDRSEAAFYAALFGLETLGLKGAWRSPTGARVAEGAKGAGQALRPLMCVSQSQAETVAKALGGTWKMAKNGKGYVIELGNPKSPTIIRLMNEGSGQRRQAYFRVAKQGKPAYTRSGKMIEDHASTHHNLHAGDIVQQIQEVLEKVPKR